MSDALHLPKSWVQVTVADLGKVVSGGTPSTKENSYWGGNISWISPSDLTGYSDKYISKGAKSITQEGLKNSSATIMPAGSIHFSSRAPIGYTVISSREITSNQGFKSLVPAQGVFNEYIYYYFKSAKQLAESRATGTTFKEISGAAFSKLPVPLPPTNEQHRIIAKIEELFSELDSGLENLKTARAQLKVYRQALLKHAFEGKLTAQWRAENQGKLETAEALLKRIQQERAERYQQQLADWENKSPSIPLLQRGKTTPTDTASIPPFVKGGLGGISKPKAPKPLPPLTAEELAELPELPEGWGWVRVGEIADVQLGRQRSPNNRSNLFPTKYIRAGNLTDSGLNLEDVLDMEFEPQERARFLLKAGDVLLSEASGSANQVGKPAVWRGEIEECCFQNTVIRVRSLDALSEYLFWVFKTYYVTGVFSKLSGGVGINHLSAGKLESMAIPLVDIFESEKLLELINEKLSLIENLDQTLATSLQQAEALRQSILKKAFSGQLVPQDPHDEPASKLLERIKAERNAQTAKPKTPKATRNSL